MQGSRNPVSEPNSTASSSISQAQNFLKLLYFGFGQFQSLYFRWRMDAEYQNYVLYGLTALAVIAVVAYYYVSSILAKSNDALAVWGKIAETPILSSFVGPIYTMLLKIRIPYSRSIDFRITSLEVGRCRGILKRNRRSDGPFKCTHGVALNLFAETLAGLAVFTRLGAHGKGILLKSETEFIKKGKGTVEGFAAFDPDEKDHVLAPAICEVIMKDLQGDTVAKSILTFKVEGVEMHNMRA